MYNGFRHIERNNTGYLTKPRLATYLKQTQKSIIRQNYVNAIIN